MLKTIMLLLGTLNPFTPAKSPEPAASREKDAPVDLTARAEIPVNFPDLLWPDASPGAVVGVIETQLECAGITLAEAGTIHVAYPHKHPKNFRDHYNAAARYAQDMVKKLRDLRPDIKWVQDDGLCETVHLDRSSVQTSLHALTGKQVYAIDPELQPQDAPFSGSDGRKDYFIIVDQCVEQGTTVANLMSYITNRGGTVLLAAAGSGSLAQRKAKGSGAAVSLSGAFNDAARNTGRLPELAGALADAAKRDGINYTPQKCLEMLDDRLQRHGNSVFALTDGECGRLIESLRGHYWGSGTSFKRLIEGLEKTPRAVPPVFLAKPAAAPPAAAPLPL